MIDKRRARKYCYQDISLIENYEQAVADKERVWHCHHRVETIMNCGSKELISVGAYYDRPAHELIFLTQGEHRIIHNQGKQHSAVTKKKMSIAKKGKPKTQKHKMKISEAIKLFWERRRTGQCL